MARFIKLYRPTYLQSLERQVAVQQCRHRAGEQRGQTRHLGGRGDAEAQEDDDQHRQCDGRQRQDAKVVAHPECEAPILDTADYIGSTNALLNYVVNDNAQKFMSAEHLAG